ncbi:MAG: CPBP family intramembrane metalloprotease [Clostridia bacterium]|nr:CPBP family intramembrane metalloprotease [Clostridia bacterium]
MDKSILKQKRKLGLSLGLIVLSSQVVFTLIELLLKYLNIEETETLTYIFNAFSLYVVSFLLVKLLLRKVENVEPKPKVKLTFKKFMWYLFIAYGLGIFCATFTNEIITMFSDLMNNEISDRVEEIMSNSTPIPLILFVAIIGPIFEELMFRGLLLKKLRVYGDKTAIIYTGIAFGLFHTNLSQILFATIIGMVFAYVVCKTNNIKYSILIHMIINLMGSIATLVAVHGTDVMQIILSVIVIFITVAAIITVPIKASKKDIEISNESKYDKKKLYNNIGYIISCIIVVIITVLAMIL